MYKRYKEIRIPSVSSQFSTELKMRNFLQSDKLCVVLLVNFHHWDISFIILSSLMEQKLSDYILKAIA